VTVHIGWVIVAALAGFIFGVLLMALMAVASNADDEMEGNDAQ
jgi:membrane associated rhomboid family serine protease